MFQALLVLLLLFVPSAVFASGFGIFTQGAQGLAQANAVVAHSTGPSSLYFNPALMTEVDGRRIEVGSTAINLQREFQSASSGQTYKIDDWHFPSTLYYTEQHGAVTAGIGLYSPFGLSTTWPSDYEGRYIATRGEIFTFNLNPAVALRVNDRLSLAVGIDVLYLDAKLDNAINQVAAGFALPAAFGGPVIDPTMPDIHQRFSGDGWGSGYNLGMTFRLGEGWTFGGAYRSEIDVKVEGDASFANVDPRLAALFPQTAGSSEIHLPQQVALGLAVDLSSRLTVELGARWEDWSSYDRQIIRVDNPVLGQNSQVIPRDWSPTWSYNLGGEYRLNDSLTLLAGYLYGEGAVPDSTFEPLIPDSDAQLFTVGLEKRFGDWSLGAAFGYEIHDDVDKANPIGDPLSGDPALTANGSYQSEIYLFGLSLGYRF